MTNFIKSENAFDNKAISLFSGAGGCSLGFSEYGYNIISAYDNWDEAVKTYNMNFKGDKCHKVDLSQFDFEEERKRINIKRGELDIIIGGPPCQGYTSAGRRDTKDPRNKLFNNYINALDVFFPQWFVMENVEGILTTGNGDFIVDCVSQMTQLGYSLFIKKVYMQEFGVPQRRKRVIIVGNRLGIKYEFPKAIVQASGHIFRNGTSTLYDAISDLEGRDDERIGHVRLYKNGIQQERICALKPGQTMKDLPKELQHPSYTKRAARRVCDGISPEKRGGAPLGLKRLLYSEPSLTITGSATSEFVHPVENRMLTTRECARIQTFPDSFVFTGTETQQEHLIGNAIPPLFANILAHSIHKQSKSAKNKVGVGLITCDITKASSMSPILYSTYNRLMYYNTETTLFNFI